MPTPGSIALVIEDGEGERESLVFDEPGGEIRFAVGEKGRRAGTWKVWAGKHNASVYAANRVLGGQLKISLHDGPLGPDWRVQWEQKFMKSHPEVANRIIERLTRPPEISSTGWTKGLSIWIRCQDVVATSPGESLPSDLVWLPPPPEGHAVGVHLVIARPTNQFVKLAGIPLGGFMLSDGQVLLLVVTQSRITDETDQQIDEAVANLMRSVSEKFDRGNLRSLVRSDSADGEPQFWDVAVLAEVPKEPV